MRLRYILILSFGFSYLFTPLIIKFAQKLKILDHPDARKTHAKAMPLLGGLSVYIAFLFSLLFNVLASKYLQGVVIAATLIFIIGLIDDIKKVPASIRLIVQVIAALILINHNIKVSFLPQGPIYDLIEYLLTIVWVLGITNAMNCLDGVDGLLSSLGVVIAGSFFLVAYQTDQLWLCCVAIALVGALIGFLRYNFSPARIFLGDAGSTFIGFILASVALLGDWAMDNKVSLFVPILVLGVPIFDMSFTTILRIKQGLVRNIGEWLRYAGRDHFHHRLLDLGLGPRGVVLLISSVSFCLGLSAIALKDADLRVALFLLLQAAIIFVIIATLMIIGGKRQREERTR